MLFIQRIFIIFILIISFIISGENDITDKIKHKIAKKIEKHKTKKFAGLNFSVGISLTHDLGSNDRIESAEVVNNIVRITKENNDIPRIMLESHYFFSGDKNSLFGDKIDGKLFSVFSNENEWGVGPFVALEPSSDGDIINSVGMGIMIGFKRNDDKKDTSSWNFGIGAVVDPNVKILGEGIYADKPLPIGETEVRYTEKSQWGLLIISSYNF